MTAIGHDTLKTRNTLTVDGKTYNYFSLPEAAKRWATSPGCRSA